MIKMEFVKRNILMEQKLHEFYYYLKTNPTNNGINLIDGVAGEILFLCYYSRYFKDETVYNEIHDKLDSIVSNINAGKDSPTLAGGICGIVWLLEHLVKENFIDYNLDELYEETDEYLVECLIHYMKNNNYDYLHGALGIANYFLNRNTQKTNKYLSHFIKLLSENSIIDNKSKTIGFKSLISNTGIPFFAFNYSLSHGMASLIYFLQKSLLHDEFKNDKDANNLIEGIHNFYYQNENDLNIYNSYFPTWIGETNIVKNARIAWCYGDVGIGITFLNYGKNHVDDVIIDYGIKILTNTLERKDVKKEIIFDAGICHGSSGLSLIYDQAHQLTKKNEFLDASNYWLDIALSQSTHPDGICGYKAYMGPENGFINSTGLLEGIAGIGLSFLSRLDRNLGNWKKVFMIS